MAISDWVAIVEAAGFDARQMTAIDAFQLAGTIMRDLRANGYRGGGSVEHLKKFSEEQKRALRERITR